MAERCDGNDTTEAEQGVCSSGVQGQSDRIIQGLGEPDESRQEAEQVGVSRQEAEWSGGSRKGVEQGDNMRDKLEDVGAVVEEPGIEVQRDTNEEAVLTGLVSTRVELAQDVLMEEVPDQCRYTHMFFLLVFDHNNHHPVPVLFCVLTADDEPTADDSHCQATSPQGQRVSALSQIEVLYDIAVIVWLVPVHLHRFAINLLHWLCLSSSVVH